MTQKDLVCKDTQDCGSTFERIPQHAVRETSEGLVLSVELPGVKRENLELNIEGRELRLRGRVDAPTFGDEFRTLQREFDDTSFRRSFRLHQGLDADSVDAKLEHGVLTLTIRRVEPERISIQVN